MAELASAIITGVGVCTASGIGIYFGMHTKRHERDTAEGGREYASNLVANLQVPAIVDRTWRLEKTQKYHTRMLVFNNVMLVVVIAKLFFPELALIAKRFFPKQSVKPLLPEQSTQVRIAACLASCC